MLDLDDTKTDRANVILDRSDKDIWQWSLAIASGMNVPIKVFSKFPAEKEFIELIHNKFEKLIEEGLNFHPGLLFIVGMEKGTMEAGYAAHIDTLKTYLWVRKNLKEEPYATVLMGTLLGLTPEELHEYKVSQGIGTMVKRDDPSRAVLHIQNYPLILEEDNEGYTIFTRYEI